MLSRATASSRGEGTQVPHLPFYGVQEEGSVLSLATADFPHCAPISAAKEEYLHSLCL